jgi:hypothetical protein
MTTFQATEFHLIVELLDEIFENCKMHNELTGQISYDCPVCSYDIKGLSHGDYKGNLEINYIIGVYKCWACSETNDTHGSLYKLIKKYGNDKQLNTYLLYRPEDVEIHNNKSNKVILPEDFVLFTEASEGLKKTPFYNQAKRYLEKRNIDDKIIKKFNIGFCYNGEYANRIIIPSYDYNLNLNYFIARSYLTSAKLKYKNPNVVKDNIIFNEYHIDWSDTIYLVEGVFDALFLDNSIPLLGKYLSEHLHETLYQRAVKIVIVLDGDAWESAQKLYHKLNCGRLMNKVFIVKLPIDKDVADLKGDISNFKQNQLD